MFKKWKLAVALLAMVGMLAAFGTGCGDDDDGSSASEAPAEEAPAEEAPAEEAPSTGNGQSSSPAPTPTPRPTTSQPPPSQQAPTPTPTPAPTASPAPILISCSINLISNSLPNVVWQISFSPESPPIYWWQISVFGLNNDGDQSSHLREGTRSSTNPIVDITEESFLPVETVTRIALEVMTDGIRPTGSPATDPRWCFMQTNY